MAVVALATSLAGPVGAPTAAADATDESVLDDLGARWRPFSCGVSASPGQLEPRCFIDDEAGATVTISGIAVPKGIDPRGILVGLSGDAPASALIDTRGLDAARGFTITDDANTLEKVALVAAGRDRVFTITFLGPPESFPDTVGLVIDVARGLQARAGGAPPRPTPPTRAQRAIDRLFAPAPAGFTTTQLDAPSDLTSLRKVARSQRVIDVLESEVVTRTRGYVATNAQIVISLDRMPYDEFAATGLGAVSRAPRQVHLAGLDDRVPDAVAVDGSGNGSHGVTIVFRRGQYVATVAIVGAHTIDPALIDGAAVEIAEVQAARLPEGATTPYYFPSNVGAALEVLAFTTAVCLLVVGFGRLRAHRRRRRVASSKERAHRVTAGNAGLDGAVDDVSGDGSRLRHAGIVMVVVQIAAVDLMVVGLLGVLGVLPWPSWWASAILLAVGLVGGVMFTRWRRRRELDAIGPATAGRAPLPAPAGLAGGAVAISLLVAGLASLTTGFAGIAFGPGLRELEWSNLVGVSPTELSVGFVAAGVVLIVVGGVAFRLAWMWARAGAQRLQQRDHRPAILYLRSFEDDELPIATVLSARRPFFELFRLGGTDPFEEAVAWELVPYGPVVAVGRPGRSLASLGAAREYLPDDRWREDVAARMAASCAIVMTIGATDGLRWEIEQVAAAQYIGRTIFVFPPMGDGTLRDRWHFTAEALDVAGVAPPPLPDDAGAVFTAVFDAPGSWWVTVADVRDEATYRAAIDRSMEWLTTRDGAEVS